jgi:hypothetical protein
VQALAEARLTAQARAGIPPEKQSPLTVQEAGRYAEILDRGNPADSASRMVTQIEEDFGRTLAPLVFGTVMQRYKISKDTSELLYGVMRRRSLGVPITPADFEDLQRKRDLDTMRRAGDWGGFEPPDLAEKSKKAVEDAKRMVAQSAGQSNPEDARTAPANGADAGVQLPARQAAESPSSREYVPGKTFIPANAITDLRTKQIEPADFDQQYGRGAALAVSKSRGLK